MTAGATTRQRLLDEMKAHGLEPDNRELGWLDQIEEVADLIASLQTVIDRDGPTLADGRISPAVVEQRLQRQTLLTLTKSLDLTGAGSGAKTAASEHGRRAAQKRWANRGAGN